MCVGWGADSRTAGSGHEKNTGFYFAPSESFLSASARTLFPRLNSATAVDVVNTFETALYTRS